MSTNEHDTVMSLARSIRSAWQTSHRFRASQIVTAGEIRLEADVQRSSERCLDLAYTLVENPWSRIETQLTGLIERTPEELHGMQFRFDGTHTLQFDPATQSVVRAPGRELFEPIPGVALFGEVGFVADLPRDFLLRDMGEALRDGVPVRRLGLRPKVTLRPSLLSATAFPVRRATIDLDPDTFFPVHLSWVPTADSAAAALLGPDVQIQIECRNVRPSDPSVPVYAPPRDIRVFERRSARLDELLEDVPFSLSLASLQRLGWNTRGPAHLTVDRERKRGFLTAHLSPLQEGASGSSRSRLSFAVGNYVSPAMARWRIVLSETGHDAPDRPGVRLLDRREMWEKALPGIDPAQAPIEAFVEHHGVFWYLSLVGGSVADVDRILGQLHEARDEGDPSPSSDA